MSKQAATVYVGRKPLMNYVLAVVTGFNAGAKKEEEVHQAVKKLRRELDDNGVIIYDTP